MCSLLSRTGNGWLSHRVGAPFPLGFSARCCLFLRAEKWGRQEPPEAPTPIRVSGGFGSLEAHQSSLSCRVFLIAAWTCSPAVRWRGTDRWPFWLALAASRQRPILPAWMIVLGTAKTNSSSTWGPNKLTDLKLQGHAWRFRFHLSAAKKERDELERKRWRFQKEAFGSGYFRPLI